MFTDHPTDICSKFDSFIYHVEALEGTTLLGVENKEENHCWVKPKTLEKKPKHLTPLSAYH